MRCLLLVGAIGLFLALTVPAGRHTLPCPKRSSNRTNRMKAARNNEEETPRVAPEDLSKASVNETYPLREHWGRFPPRFTCYPAGTQCGRKRKYDTHYRNFHCCGQSLCKKKRNSDKFTCIQMPCWGPCELDY